MSGRVGQGLALENLRAHHVAATTMDGLSVPSNGDLTLALNTNKPPHPDVPSLRATLMPSRTMPREPWGSHPKSLEPVFRIFRSAFHAGRM